MAMNAAMNTAKAKDGFDMSAAAAQFPISPGTHEHRRQRPVLVIDGEATIVSRRARAAEPVAGDGAEARPEVPVEPRPQVDEALDARLRYKAANQRSSSPDLVFQHARRGMQARAEGAASRRGLDIFTDAARPGGARRNRRLAGLAAIVALLSLPVFVLSAPIAPAEATPGLGGPVIAPLVIDQIATSIVPRGAGAVLTVDARIRNVSGAVAAIAPVRITLVEPDGGHRSKSLVPGVSTLGAGRSVRFHSTVAVAKDTRGAVEVGFVAPPASSGKTHPE
ncbi:hypothetical protein ASG62_12115 [Aureimonas sp. Leaf427]|nr:hypothetical protein ASG62_12115 [Aureimonas sp. Leaf427]